MVNKHSFGTQISNLRKEISFFQNAINLQEQAKAVVEEEIFSSLRDGNETLICVIFDFDKFWSVAKTRKAVSIESFLSHINNFLKRSVDNGQVFSYGRDEFLAIASGIRLEDALIFAEKKRSQLAELIIEWATEQTSSKQLFDLSLVGCSAGISIFPDHAQDSRELIRAAEEALYSAKLAGRNRTMLPLQEKMVLKSNFYTIVQNERLKLLAKRTNQRESSLLREALDNLLRSYDI